MKTTFATNNALTKKLWDEDLFRDVEASSFFQSRMGSEGEDAFIQVQTDLTKSQGDQVTFGLVENLDGDGVTSGTVLEGNEEGLDSHDYSIVLEQYRHGTRTRGKLDVQRAMFSIPTISRTKLKLWGGEKIDKLFAAALVASFTKILYRDGVAGVTSGTGTASTAKTALTAANSKVTPEFLSAARVWARTGGNGSAWRIRPVMIDGVEGYIAIFNPAALFDLRINPTYAAAIKDAMERGKTNPLFRGAVMIWDNIIIHESERIPLFTDGGGASVTGCFGALMGAQALCWAWGERGKVVQDTFDYGNEQGWAFEMMAKAGKPKYNSIDYAVIGLCVACSNVTLL